MPTEYPSVAREEAKLEVGAGWRALLDPLYDYCEKHGVKVLQVKEKFGGLRFYTEQAQWECGAQDPASDAASQNWRLNELGKLVKAAEEASEVTCEWCGAPGIRRGGAWIKTLCNEHAERWNKGERWK